MALPTIDNNNAPLADKKRAQSLLVANSFPPANSFNSQGEPDGQWGAGSEAALKRFQVARKVRGSVLPSGQGDGILGDNSWAALLGA